MLGRLGSRSWGLVVAALLAGTALAGTVTPAAAAPAPANGAGTYLALGDSVAFGYRPPQYRPRPNYFKPWTFVGYPEDLAKQLGLSVANASCPGETTVSMEVPGGLSNGCENSPTTPYGYRTFFPLHVLYLGTQLHYAVDYLRDHPATSLVSIDIGANDFFVCQEITADHCTSPSEIHAVLSEVGAHLASVYAALRTQAGYRGTIVALSYYSLSYTNKVIEAGTLALDRVISNVSGAYGVVVANGFKAFLVASQPYGGNPCAAGLLLPLPNGTCDIHPSAAGHSLLADTIARAIGR